MNRRGGFSIFILLVLTVVLSGCGKDIPVSDLQGEWDVSASDRRATILRAFRISGDYFEPLLRFQHNGFVRFGCRSRFTVNGTALIVQRSEERGCPDTSFTATLEKVSASSLTLQGAARSVYQKSTVDAIYRKYRGRR